MFLDQRAAVKPKKNIPIADPSAIELGYRGASLTSDDAPPIQRFQAAPTSPAGIFAPRFLALRVGQDADPAFPRIISVCRGVPAIIDPVPCAMRAAPCGA